ncbi:DUF6533 domain-containing protein [Sporobolomyces salmoneus]|uniref:DUF6533 domain-containing protein n=1 Tax=Sporobolomyces salmoneus TaxID=183962 RepID=UPI00317A472E
MDSAPPPALTPALLSSLLDLRSTVHAQQKYMTAWLGIFLFDLVITLPDERKYIWNNKWTPLKVLYLLNRYTSLVYQVFAASMILFSIPTTVCDRAWWFQIVGGMLSVYICALIMAIRVAAIYDRNIYVIIFLGVLLAGELAVFIFCVTVQEAFQLPPMVSKIVDFNGCMIKSREDRYEKIGAAVWSAPLGFDFVALILTLYRCFKVSTFSGSKTPLVRKILSTGIFYFVIITVSNLANVVLFSLPSASPSLNTFHAVASSAITSIMCSRMVLSLFSPNSMSFVLERLLRSSGTKHRVPGHHGGASTGNFGGGGRSGAIGVLVSKEGIELSPTINGTGTGSSSPRFAFSRAFPMDGDSKDDFTTRPFEEAFVVENEGDAGGQRTERGGTAGSGGAGTGGGLLAGGPGGGIKVDRTVTLVAEEHV